MKAKLIYESLRDKLTGPTKEESADVFKTLSKTKQLNVFLNAINSHNYNTVKFLIEQGIDINYTNASVYVYRTPIMLAIRIGDNDMVKLFIKYGADVNVVDSEYTTTIMYAIIYNHFDIAKTILETNKVFNLDYINNYQMSAFDYANGSDDKRFIKLLNKYKKLSDENYNKMNKIKI